MSTPRLFLEQLLARQDLSEAQAGRLLQALSAPDLAPAMGGALLTALRAKGVTADELRGFAGAMRSLARKPELPGDLDAIDIVGTGGDGSGSLNLSTGAALLAAAGGLPVLKHGNRSSSSRSGSADMMEALGFTLPLDEKRAADCFHATGFAFLFAPYFHPAMKALATIRAALGIRTVFNLLGPLTNPCAPRFLLAGAFNAEAAELMAGTLAGTRIERGWVVHGAAGWDEASTIGPFLVFAVDATGIRRQEMDPQDFGLARCTPAELAGGDAHSNLQALEHVFAGRERGAHLDTLLLQCGLASMIAGRSESLEQGIAAARDTIASGRAEAWLARLREFAIATS